MMKHVFFLVLFSSFSALAASPTISGKVELPPGCGTKAMVWLSLDKENYNERLLLMHTEVPNKGTFEFYVKPGDYQIRASDPVGCEFVQKVSVKGISPKLSVKLVKK